MSGDTSEATKPKATEDTELTPVELEVEQRQSIGRELSRVLNGLPQYEDNKPGQ